MLETSASPGIRLGEDPRHRVSQISVGPVDVGKHSLERGDTPLLPHVPRDRRVAQPDRHVEEAPVGPVVIAVEVPDELRAHGFSSYSRTARVSPS